MTVSARPPLDEVAADICVIGAGPSGSATACRLAQFGYKVVLIDRPQFQRRPRLECFAPPVRAIFDALGLRDIMAGVGVPCGFFFRRWADAEDVSSSEDGASLIERDRFDRALVRAAATSGAIVLSSARAHAPKWTQHGWCIGADTGRGFTTVTAAFVVDATGRARAGRRRRTGAPSTAALSSQWIGSEAPVAAEMLIEAMADHWLWAARLPDGRICTTMFVDLDSCRGLDRSRRASRFADLIARSSLLRRTGPSCIDNVDICDASACASDVVATRHMIKVGDAATTFDPISSQGVQSALRSAIQGSTVVHTILSGGDAAAAICFYRRSQQTCFAHHVAATAQAYAAPGAKYQTDFWRRRSSVAAGRSVPRSTRPINSELAPETRLCISPQAKVTLTPTLDGNIIRRTEAVVHPSLSEPVAYLGDLHLATVLRLIKDRQDKSQMQAACTHLMSPGRAAAVLDWMLQSGIVIAAGS